MSEQQSQQTTTAVQSTQTSACPHPEAVGVRWGDPISIVRKGELAAMLEAWDASGSVDRLQKSPFDSVQLTGAEVAWLAEQSAQGRRVDEMGDNFHLEGADLRDAHLEGARLSLVHLDGANLYAAYLMGADLRGASLKGADLSLAHLEGAYCSLADFEGANLYAARLEGADLYVAYLERSDLRGACLNGADLRGVRFDNTTELTAATLDDTTRLADIRWGGVGSVDLTRLPWDKVRRIGDERGVTLFANVRKHETVVRAYRQLAAQLRVQGISEVSDRFAYRAQVCQRRVYLRRFRIPQYFGSLFLGLISGYGYRPMRSFITYVLVILGFAAVYFGLGGSSGHPLSWNEAIVVSMTAFHGRGFFAAVFQPGDLQAAVAAVEAFIGLLIEIVFITTFTQRFFAR